jgi:hypothetical protein
MVLLTRRSHRQRPAPGAAEPWDNFFHFTIEQNLHRDQLIRCLRMIQGPYLNPVGQQMSTIYFFLKDMLFMVDTTHNFADLYQYISQQTNNYANPLYAPYLPVPNAPDITPSMRQLINWCNTALQLIPGIPSSHRIF